MLNSCTKTKSITQKSNHIDFNYWSIVEISPENQKITIYYNIDTAEILTWVWKDTSINGNGNCRIKKLKTIEEFYISQQDRDTVFEYTFQIIRDTTRPKNFCTEYCGHVNFNIQARQVSLSSSYTSICYWNEINDKTKNIYSILSKKNKIQNSSDCL